MSPTEARTALITGRVSADEALEARLAARLAVALTRANENLPHDVSERLRFARERALAAAAQGRRVAATATASGSVIDRIAPSGAATLGRFANWWHGAAVLLPLAVLVAGLVLIDDRVEQEQVRAVADIDAQILTDDLPPQAYSDPGFAEYLRSAPSP